MNTPMIASPLMLLAIVYLWCLYTRKKAAMTSRARSSHGIKLLALLRTLLEHIPQHRGSANALLNGDSNFRNKVSDLQKAIQSDIQNVNHAFTNQTPSLIDRWQHIKSAWGNLIHKLNTLSPEESFEIHSDIINQLIYLMQDISNLCLSNSSSKTQETANLCFHQLPIVIELCGQARGIGMGAIAHGKPTTATRIKLTFLHERLASELKAIAGQHSSEFDQTSQTNTHHFLTTIKQEILDSEKTSITPTAYFEQGSKAIMAGLSIMDRFITSQKKSHQ